jgi:hypothetical protein
MVGFVGVESPMSRRLLALARFAKSIAIRIAPLPTNAAFIAIQVRRGDIGTYSAKQA